MTQWVNFAEIRAKVSLEDVISRLYGITNLTREGTRLVGPCPVHGGDSPRAFHADLEKNVWHCFSRCKGGGNQLDFVAKKEGVSIRDAALKLQAAFLLRDPPPRPLAAPAPVAAAQAPPSRPRRETSPTDEGNPPLELTLHLLADHPHLMTDRALELPTVEHFGVGYCPRGILAGTIAIPIRDENGVLVAYAGRRLKPQDIREKGKYKFPKGFRKELVLYHFEEAKGHMEGKGLILVEGFFSVLKLFEMGVVNVVASMGCELSDAQAQLLVAAAEVFILFDGNEAGYTGATRAKEKLEPLGVTVHVARLPQDCEPEDIEPRALRWLFNGMRELRLASVAIEVLASPKETEG